jgi:hypothetical protein
VIGDRHGLAALGLDPLDQLVRGKFEVKVRSATLELLTRLGVARLD